MPFLSAQRSPGFEQDGSYDFTIWVPIVALMAHDRSEREALRLAVGCWIGTLPLPILGYALRVAAPAALRLWAAAVHAWRVRIALQGEPRCTG